MSGPIFASYCKRIQSFFRYCDNMKKLVLSLLLLPLSALCMHLFAQDTLPNFSVSNVGNGKVIVGWTNKFETVKQISIQRSFDSLKGYKSIHTIADPTTPQNGYVDTRAANDHMFYRLYILLEGGVYLFSKPKKPVIDTLKKTGFNNGKMDRMSGNDTISIPNFGMNNGKPKPDVFTPSLHVFTAKDGNIRVSLPDEEDMKYTIRFFDMDDNFLFELKEVKQRTFHIDKANFFHAGWFKFELYENERLKEKHKFYVQKEF
jgi:hypothetical protein